MATQVFTMTPNTSALTFHLRHLILSDIAGRIGNWNAALHRSTEPPQDFSIEVEMDLASIETGSEDRDVHLRSAEFFDVARYPVATFKSTRVEWVDESHVRVTGVLDLHGAKRIVVVDALETARTLRSDGRTEINVKATARIDRREFGLRWNQDLDIGGVVVGDQVEIIIEGTAHQDLTAPAD